MFNKQDLIRSELSKKLNNYLQDYFFRLGLKCDLGWEIRGDTQCVSDCFVFADRSDISSISSVLEQSGIFTSVSNVLSREYIGESRILLKTDNISQMMLQFRYAQYVNTLIGVMPVSGILCVPSLQRNQLTIQPCAAINSFSVVPNLLKLLGISWTAISPARIAISCDNVKDLILQQKKLCLSVIVEMVNQVSEGIKICGQAVNICYLSSSPRSVFMNFSDDLWDTTPGIIMDVPKNLYIIDEIEKWSSDLLEVKISGYYDKDHDLIVPYGIKLKSIFNIPLFLKDKITFEIKQERTNYLNRLMVFKGKAKEYGIATLPFDISKKILIEAADNTCLLTENEQGEIIEKIIAKV